MFYYTFDPRLFFSLLSPALRPFVRSANARREGKKSVNWAVFFIPRAILFSMSCDSLKARTLEKISATDEPTDRPSVRSTRLNHWPPFHSHSLSLQLPLARLRRRKAEQERAVRVRSLFLWTEIVHGRLPVPPSGPAFSSHKYPTEALTQK